MPYYKYDSDADEYIKLDKPPRAKKLRLKEVEFPYSNDASHTYTVIMLASEDSEVGKVLREFEAWVFN